MYVRLFHTFNFVSNVICLQIVEICHYDNAKPIVKRTGEVRSIYIFKTHFHSGYLRCYRVYNYYCQLLLNIVCVIL